MRIGIDIDDTIKNTYYRLLKKLRKFINMIIMNCYKKYNYSKIYELLFFNNKRINNFDEILKDVDLKTNAKNVINVLSKKYKIYFITARNNNEYSEPYIYTEKFLKNNNIDYKVLAVDIRDKGKYCKENSIDLFIDDNIYNSESTL